MTISIRIPKKKSYYVFSEQENIYMYEDYIPLEQTFLSSGKNLS